MALGAGANSGGTGVPRSRGLPRDTAAPAFLPTHRRVRHTRPPLINLLPSHVGILGGPMTGRHQEGCSQGLALSARDLSLWLPVPPPPRPPAVLPARAGDATTGVWSCTCEGLKGRSPSLF